MSDLEKRVEKLEALVKKLMQPVVPIAKSMDQFAIRMKSALFNIEHVMLNRDLLRTDDIVVAMASISADIAFSGFNPRDEESMKAQVKMVAGKLRLIPELKSMVMTSYYNIVDNEDLSNGNRRFNKSVWVIRNHEKYKLMTVTQRYNEYNAQRTRVNVEYQNRCKALGWNKEEYPKYPWLFPTDQGPVDKPSFL